MPDAVVIGAGPNGLVGANLLADRGWSVTVLEAAAEPGGAVRSAELMEPGFVNDVFSAFYPFGMVSPALTGLRLEEHGLRWGRRLRAARRPVARSGARRLLRVGVVRARSGSRLAGSRRRLERIDRRARGAPASARRRDRVRRAG